MSDATLSDSPDMGQSSSSGACGVQANPRKYLMAIEKPAGALKTRDASPQERQNTQRAAMDNFKSIVAQSVDLVITGRQQADVSAQGWGYNPVRWWRWSGGFGNGDSSKWRPLGRRSGWVPAPFCRTAAAGRRQPPPLRPKPPPAI